MTSPPILAAGRSRLLRAAACGCLLAGVLFAGCAPSPGTAAGETAASSSPSPSLSPSSPSPAVGAAASPAAPTFVNRVWKVSHSPTVERGGLYTFLSDGTLVIASPKNKPSLGTWAKKGAGLEMVEEGQTYPVEILSLSADTFRIRLSNPGQPVEITFVPG